MISKITRAKDLPDISDIKKGLCFPDKIVFDRRTGLVAIADTASNRIIIADRHASVKKIIGSGIAGSRDGDFSGAQFNNPRGMTFFMGKLYIADTGNHLVRMADFFTGEVYTAAGTGCRGQLPRSYGPPLEVDLNFPWDLASSGDKIYAAMTGCHQIWELYPDGEIMRAYAGAGIAGSHDGSLKEALFAGPSGLTSDFTGNLYCTDAQTGSIRRIDLKNKKVETLSIAGYCYSGENEGIPLCQPLGVAWDPAGSRLYVSDSRSGRVLVIDPVKKIAWLYASGFSEPGGITVFYNGVLITDTGVHRILKVEGNLIEEFGLNWDSLEYQGMEARHLPEGKPYPGIEHYHSTMPTAFLH